jgi:ssDNA-binding Zn-finger/Zn-ribbon topoisomerase 1
MLTSSDWERWKLSSVEGYHPFTDYPFLVGLVSRIDRFLSDHPGSPIEIGSVVCPYCRETLSMKEDFSPKCPECGSGDMQLTGGGIASVRGNWPPLI